MIYIVLLISFLLETAFSNIFYINSLFIPLFLITSLTLLFPYFKNNNLYFIIVCALCGLMYDVIGYNSIFVNTLAFIMDGCFIVFMYNYISYNIISSNIINIVILALYRIVSYFILCMIDFLTFNLHILLRGIYSSIILNIFYGVFLFLILQFLSKKFNIKKFE